MESIQNASHPGNIEISREYPLDIHLFPHHPLSGNNIEGIPLEYLNSIKSFFCYSGNIPRISENRLIPKDFEGISQELVKIS